MRFDGLPNGVRGKEVYQEISDRIMNRIASLRANMKVRLAKIGFCFGVKRGRCHGRDRTQEELPDIFLGRSSTINRSSKIWLGAASGL